MVAGAPPPASSPLLEPPRALARLTAVPRCPPPAWECPHRHTLALHLQPLATRVRSRHILLWLRCLQRVPIPFALRIPSWHSPPAYCIAVRSVGTMPNPTSACDQTQSPAGGLRCPPANRSRVNTHIFVPCSASALLCARRCCACSSGQAPRPGVKTPCVTQSNRPRGRGHLEGASSDSVRCSGRQRAREATQVCTGGTGGSQGLGGPDSPRLRGGLPPARRSRRPARHRLACVVVGVGWQRQR